LARRFAVRWLYSPKNDERTRVQPLPDGCVRDGGNSRLSGREARWRGHLWRFTELVPYEYGKFVCMKKTLHIDERLLRDARTAAGAKTDTETVRLGLEALVRRAAYDRLRALRGSEPDAAETPRRRERPVSANHSTA
jgi:Arc/MetJ family transcription regulator